METKKEKPKAKPTRYRGRNYRSKTEAKVAALMLLLGGSYTYERDCYTISESCKYRPDFKLRSAYIIKHGITRDVFVEAKGGDLKADCSNKVTAMYSASRSNGVWSYPVLIVGWPVNIARIEYSGDDSEDWETLKRYVLECYNDRQNYSNNIRYFSFASIDGESTPALLCAPLNKDMCVAICRIGTADEDAVNISSTMAAYRSLSDEITMFEPCATQMYATPVESVADVDISAGQHTFTVVDATIGRNGIGPDAQPDYAMVDLLITDIEPPTVIPMYFNSGANWDDPQRGHKALLQSVNASEENWVEDVLGRSGAAYMIAGDDGRIDMRCYIPHEQLHQAGGKDSPQGGTSQDDVLPDDVPRDVIGWVDDEGTFSPDDLEEAAPAHEATCGQSVPAGTCMVLTIADSIANKIGALATLTGESEESIIVKFISDSVSKTIAEMNLPF